MMQVLFDIINEAVDAIVELNWYKMPTELEIIQGMRPGEWWVHTDADVYVHVQWLTGYGLSTSVHEYINVN